MRGESNSQNAPTRLPLRRRLLAIDVDGTLVNSRDELSLRTRAALHAAAEAGVRLVVATGRRYSHVIHLVEQLQIDSPVVSAGGSLIKRPGDHATLYASLFERALLCQLLREVADAGFDALLYADTFAEGIDYYCPTLEVSEPALAEYLAMNPGRGRCEPRLMHDPPEGIFGGFVMGTRVQMLQLRDRLDAALPGLLDMHVLRSPRYQGYMCELAPAGVSKWSGIWQLSQSWGIAAEEICAVGDDVNDIAMIRAAGLGVAMGNADPAVKAAADRVAPTHDEDGLAEVVAWLLRGE